MRALHLCVAFGVMPVFAPALSGVHLAGVGLAQALGPIATGAGLGPLAGETCGVFAFTWVATRLGVAPIPGGASAANSSASRSWRGSASRWPSSSRGWRSRANRPPRPGEDRHIGGSLLAGVVGALVLRATAAVAEAGAGAAAGRDGLTDDP